MSPFCPIFKLGYDDFLKMVDIKYQRNPLVYPFTSDRERCSYETKNIFFSLNYTVEFAMVCMVRQKRKE